jgi:hypothetical protein
MNSLRVAGISALLVLSVGMAFGRDAAQGVGKGAAKTGHLVKHAGRRAGHATESGLRGAGRGTKAAAKDSVKGARKAPKKTGEGIKDAVSK